MFDEAKRTVHPNIQNARDALAVVEPLQRNIHAWQLKTAQLIGLGERTRGDGSQRPRYLEEARTLWHEIDAARLSLNQKIADLPAAIANNSRIVDTTRALDGMTAVLSEAIATLQGATGEIAPGAI